MCSHPLKNRGLAMRFYGNKHVKRIIFFLMLGYIFSPPSYAQKGGASPAQGQGNGTAGGGSTPYFETQMLAYGAVNQLAETITQEVCTNIKAPENPIVIIYDQSSFQNLQAWQSFVASTHMLEKAYGTLLSTDVVSSLLLPP